jgi:hypothetical protein
MSFSFLSPVRIGMNSTRIAVRIKLHDMLAKYSSNPTIAWVLADTNFVATKKIGRWPKTKTRA